MDPMIPNVVKRVRFQSIDTASPVSNFSINKVNGHLISTHPASQVTFLSHSILASKDEYISAKCFLSQLRNDSLWRFHIRRVDLETFWIAQICHQTDLVAVGFRCKNCLIPKPSPDTPKINKSQLLSKSAPSILKTRPSSRPAESSGNRITSEIEKHLTMNGYFKESRDQHVQQAENLSSSPMSNRKDSNSAANVNGVKIKLGHSNGNSSKITDILDSRVTTGLILTPVTFTILSHDPLILLNFIEMLQVSRQVRQRWSGRVGWSDSQERSMAYQMLCVQNLQQVALRSSLLSSQQRNLLSNTFQWTNALQDHLCGLWIRKSPLKQKESASMDCIDISLFCQTFKPIKSNEYIFAENKLWHLDHFICWNCDKSLGGQKYLVDQSKPYCTHCYDQLFSKVNTTS